jgi:hypothetical protein
MSKQEGGSMSVAEQIKKAQDVSDEIDLVKAVLNGYPQSMARSDALRALRVIADSHTKSTAILGALPSSDVQTKPEQVDPTGGVADPKPDMAESLVEVACTLQELMRFLEDTSHKRRPDKDFDLIGNYTTANIASVAKMAAWHLKSIQGAHGRLHDVILELSPGIGLSEIDLLRQQSAEEILKLKRRIAELESVPPLYAAVEEAAGALPNGWEIRLCVELGAGTVELFDPDGVESDFATNNERLDFTVKDALDAAQSIHRAQQPAPAQGE